MHIFQVLLAYTTGARFGHVTYMAIGHRMCTNGGTLSS